MVEVSVFDQSALFFLQPFFLVRCSNVAICSTVVAMVIYSMRRAPEKGPRLAKLDRRLEVLLTRLMRAVGELI